MTSAAQPPSPHVSPPGAPPPPPFPVPPPTKWPPFTPEELAFIETLVIRDDEPVESLFAERQMAVLADSLLASWTPPGDDKRFLAVANVGLFWSLTEPPLVPDVMAAVGVEYPGDPKTKANNSYFVRRFGKPPDVVVELVSDRRGGELTEKRDLYARIGVPYYIVYDPVGHLRSGPLHLFALRGDRYEPMTDLWIEPLGLGLTIGVLPHPHAKARALRWCDRSGAPLPTGTELARRETDRANRETDRAQREADRANHESDRAQREADRARRLAERLRAAGIDPGDDGPTA
jgi:hypothetical protein